VASGTSNLGGLGGGSIGWEFNRRVGLEGAGSWFDRGNGADAFAASLVAQAALTPFQRWVPFVEGGPAMYRASFDTSRADIPSFYRNRLAGSSIGETVAFRDPAFVVGGGINFFTLGHLAIRPAVNVLVAIRDSDTYSVATFTIRAVYHFEHHPVKP
jgi:hypothetical protein